MKKITILALHLGYGGIEKCIATLANSLVEQYEVEIISTYKLYEKSVFPISPKVKISYLLEEKPNKEEFLDAIKHFNIKKAYQEYSYGKKVLALKKSRMIDAIKSCDSDIIISTRDIHNEWLGKFGKRDQIKIGWEHNHHHNNKKYSKKVIKSVENLDYFILVSEELKEFYEPKVKCKCFYIPNAIDEIPIEKSKLEEKRIISVGRLSKEKGFLDIVDVFKLVNAKYPDWKLSIIGDGNERNLIEQKIKDNHLENIITLHGYQEKDFINQMYHDSSIYVMGSKTESFGIVLVEAFSYGLPCVAFDSAEGAKALISDNWDGYLVRDRNKEQMAKRICELIQNPNRRIIMGDNGRKKAEYYHIDQIKGKWFSLLKKGDL